MKANTVLTNLQRGNIPTMQTIVVDPVETTIHQRQGKLYYKNLKVEFCCLVLSQGKLNYKDEFSIKLFLSSIRAGMGELKAKEMNAELVTERDARRRTPLMWAAAYGQTPTVQARKTNHQNEGARKSTTYMLINCP